MMHLHIANASANDSAHVSDHCTRQLPGNQLSGHMRRLRVSTSLGYRRLPPTARPTVHRAGSPPSKRTLSDRRAQPTRTFTAAVISASAFLASAKYMPVFGSV